MVNAPVQWEVEKFGRIRRMKTKYQLKGGFVIVTTEEPGNHGKPRYKLNHGYNKLNPTI